MRKSLWTVVAAWTVYALLMTGCAWWSRKASPERRTEFRYNGGWPLDDVSVFRGKARKAVIWANALWHTHRYDEAAASLEPVVDHLTPRTDQYERVILALGLLYESMGDWDRARHWYSLSLTDGRGFGEARFKVMMAMVLSQKACIEARDGCSSEPFAAVCREGNLHACKDMGVAEVYMGHYPRALKMFRDACRKGDQESCVHATWLDAAILGHGGDLEDTLQPLCNDNVGLACALLAHYYHMREPSCSEMVTFLAQQGCEQGAWQGCYEMVKCGGDTQAGELKEMVGKVCLGWSPWSTEACLALGELERTSPDAMRAYVRASVLLRHQCEGGGGWACNELSALYREGRGVMKDDSKAHEYAKKACDLGYMPGCVSVWALDYSRDPKKALAVFMDACMKGIGRGCGLYAIHAKETVPDMILQKGCSEHDALSCRLLGERHAARSDWAKAVQLLRRACTLGDGQACARLGSLYASGTGVVWDAQKAFKMYDKACSKGEIHACVKLADMYTIGAVVRQDYSRAVRLYTQACQKDVGTACNSLGEFYLLGMAVDPDTRKALSLFDKACRLGTPIGCFNLGNLYLKGMGVERDAMVAANLFEKACEENYGLACYSLATMAREGVVGEKDLRRAKMLYYKACTLGDTRGCEWTAYLELSKGRKSRRLSFARRLYAKICGWDRTSACHNLAYMRLRALGGPRDLGSAAHTFMELCRKGFAPSCAALKYMASKWMLKGAQRSEALKLVKEKCGDGGCGKLRVAPPMNK